MISRYGKTVCVLATVAASILCSSCNVTRRLPQGSYLLQKVKIEDDKSVPRKERIEGDEVRKYVRQRPNKHFLGTNFYVWVYNLANPDKDNWWNNFKRKIGEEPVLLDMSLTEKSAENLKIYLDSRGYFASKVSYDVDTTYRRKRAKVTYSLKQNRAYRIDRISYVFRDRFLEPILLPDTVNTLLHVGDIFDISVLDKERERIAGFLKDRGYYGFSVNNIEYIADTLTNSNMVGVKVVVKQNLAGYNNRGEAVYDNNAVYRLRNINIVPNYNAAESKLQGGAYYDRFDTISYRGLNVMYEGRRPNIRARVLRPAIPMYPNFIYDYSQVTRAYSNLMQMGYFKSARIVFDELPDSLSPRSYITYVGGDMSKSDSTRVNYTREGYVDCNILCTPALKQSIKVELEGSTTSSFYGVKASVGYQNRNIFRGAEMLELVGTVGYEYMKAPKSSRRNAMEFGLSAGLSFPRFLIFPTSPLSRIVAPRTQFEISYNYQNRPYYRRDLSSIVWSYSWRNMNHSTFVVRPININWVNVGYINKDYFDSLQNEYLKHSYESQLILGISGSYLYNNPRLQTTRNQTTVRLNWELAGNLLDGLEHLFSKPAAGEKYYKILGIRYSQYFRADLSVSHKIMLGEVTAVAGRIYAGFGAAYGNSQAMPFDRMFYSGGSNSMRGWAPRTLGPGSSPLPTNVVYPTQLGDMKLEANLEFRFPIWGIFHGATFFDVGNIWYMGRNDVEYNPESVFHFRDFYKQLGFNTGIGIRIDIKFAILRLDWGIQLHNPNNPAGKRWIHDFKWRNTSLNFGVGYPF